MYTSLGENGIRNQPEIRFTPWQTNIAIGNGPFIVVIFHMLMLVYQRVSYM